ncbi:helix-turn-helix transcriptional regulator [Escherichia coli]
MIWQPEFTDKTLSRKPGAVQSRSTIYEKLNPESRYYDETFPKPVRLGAASVGWRSTSVDEWIASRSV